MFCLQFLVVLPLLHTVSSLLNHHLPQSHGSSSALEKNFLLPASRKVILNFHAVEKREKQQGFDREAHQFLQESARENSRTLRFAALLKRRDSINLYGRQIVHSELDANCATLLFFDNISDVTDQIHHHHTNSWDATLSLAPESEDTPRVPEKRDKKCFVAMNRFVVKKECKSLFEERWSERKSRLPFQPGFLGFSLLRRRKYQSSVSVSNKDEEADSCAHFNYSTCTLWNSEESWEQWRSGEGRSSHDASRKVNPARVPITEWLEVPASPIFWEGEISMDSYVCSSS